MSDQYVGEMRLFAFSRIPNGWLACNGALLAINQYEVLYALIGTTYGGDGVTTFAVPDLRGRVPMHQGQGNGLSPHPIGMVSGTESVTLLTSQLPMHTHPLTVTSANATQFSPAGVQLGALGSDTTYATDATGAGTFPMAPLMVQPAGSNQPHDNMMPTLVASMCIAYVGVYPSQG
ncbi:tail fiber protein [Bacillus sp. NP157]|nr:tail fiber protein [Bacillus sp. NP157]